MDVITLIAAAAAASVQAAEPPSTDQPQERQICRRVGPATSSRMGPRRVCKTASEWAATARSAGGDMDAESGMDPLAHNPTTRDVGGLPPGPGEGTGSAGPRN